MRLTEIDGRWLASAATPDGPSLGIGYAAVPAIEGALQLVGGVVAELLASLEE